MPNQNINRDNPAAARSAMRPAQNGMRPASDNGNGEIEPCSVVEFPELTFTAPGVYEYILKETSIAGGGWTPDGAEFRVIITVIDDGNEQLVASVEYPDGSPEFTNTFTLIPARVVIGALKFAVGAPLQCGQFQFGLFDEDGNLVAATSNGTEPGAPVEVPPRPSP